MAKSFVLNDFLRHVDPMLLQAYFIHHHIPFPANPADPSQKLVEAILRLLDNLPSKLLTVIEIDLTQVNELATYTAQTILIDLAQTRKIQLPDEIVDMTQYDTALWFFLHAPTVFMQVLRDYELEDMLGWREFLVAKGAYKSIPSRIQALQTTLQNYLVTQEYRGKNCIVEQYRKKDVIFYIAYPEDYARVKITYIKPQQLNKQVCKPVQRIYFRYDLSSGILSIKGFRSQRKLEAYREIFCRAVLGNKPIAQKRYLCNLALLTNPGFHLACGSDIDRISITSVMVTLADRMRNITLDFHTNAPANIADLHRQFREYNLSIEHLIVIRAKFCFKFKVSVITQGRNSVTCYLAIPNAHNLTDHPLHQRVMAYFKQWGLYHLAGNEAPAQPPQL